MCAKSLYSCSTLCDPMDHSLPDTSVHGILQARILAWVAISFFRDFSQPRGGTCISSVSCIGRRVLYHWCHLWELIQSSSCVQLIHPHQSLACPYYLHNKIFPTHLEPALPQNQPVFQGLRFLSRRVVFRNQDLCALLLGYCGV